MNILFLRGAVPPKNEHPEKLLYERIEECEDVWTQLFYFLTVKFDAIGELLYKDGKRIFRVDDYFSERWLSENKFEKYVPSYKPDLIIGRGGFSYYNAIFKKFPKAKKVYYGAGKRFYPQDNSVKYDLFLVDSQKVSRGVIASLAKQSHVL